MLEISKGEEAKWTGLNEWLSQQQGSVSKADIQKYLKENRVQIVEVVKGNELGEQDYQQQLDELYAEQKRIELEAKPYTDKGEDAPQELIDRNTDVGDKIDALKKRFYEKPTKHDRYQLEGDKSNYREILVTMPSFKWAKNKSGLWAYFNNEGVQISDGMPENTETYKEFAKNTLKKSQAKPNFKSSHFDEPNILVHLRMNTRTDADGNKVLFLEEVQSDWGQKGKKEGFANIDKLPDGYRIEEPSKFSNWTVVEPSGIDGNIQSTTIGQGETKINISKADIQKFSKENRIEVVEVVKNSENIGAIWNDKYEAWETTVDGKPIGDFADTKDEAIRYGKANFGDATKFGNYQLEGEKENYKEVLVTMPSRNDNLSEKEYEEFRRIDDKVYYDRTPEEQRKYVEYQNRFTKSRETNKDFKSSHFDEPNILVHLRMNTRTDADGNKVLFLEEVQSDWGQKGKKGGFTEDKYKGLSDEDAIKKSGVKIIPIAGDFKYGAELVYPNGEVYSYKNKENAEKQLLSDLRKNKTPQSPFITDTNAWTKLGLKTALKEAVAQGAERIAWTTGEQQNEMLWGEAGGRPQSDGG